RLKPAPGEATERDVTAIHLREGRLYELVDGILVEKVMAFPEAILAAHIIYLLKKHQERRSLGIVAGADGTLRIMPGLVRIPDVSFVSWDRLPNRQPPSEPIPDLVPDLAVEVISKGNTKSEMRRKLRDYFLAGVRLVWFVYPKKRTVQVFT